MVSNKAMFISIAFAAIASGSISFLASCMIIITIFRSNLKLSTVYRRLIFGLSTFDVIQSFAQIMANVSSPADSGMWGALGNDTTCDVRGFCGNIGVLGSVLYSCSISVYFLCVTKFELTEVTIKKYVEPFLHFVPVVYSVTAGLYILFSNYYNPSGPVCWIGPNDASVEKERKKAELLGWVAAGVPLFVAFALNIVVLAIIWYNVYNQSRRMSEFHLRASGMEITSASPVSRAQVTSRQSSLLIVPPPSTSLLASPSPRPSDSQSGLLRSSFKINSSSCNSEARASTEKAKMEEGSTEQDQKQEQDLGHEQEQDKVSISSSFKSFFSNNLTGTDQPQSQSQQRENSHRSSFNIALALRSPSRSINTNNNINRNNLGPLAERLSRPNRGTMQILKEITHRATAYILGFFLTYLFTTINRLMIAYGTDTPFVIVLFARFFLSLQGFFNILIYTYPHVITYRRRHDGASWFRSFWEVIKSGGDSDQVRPKRRRIPSRNHNRRTRTPIRRDSMRNEPVVLDVGQSFVSDVERVRLNYCNCSNNAELGDNDLLSMKLDDAYQV